jgi:hypothetical protein
VEHLDKIQFFKKAKKAFDSVFVSVNPYGRPFQPGVQPRLLLYGFQWSLDEPWLDPILRYIKSRKEPGFYVTAFSRSQPDLAPENYAHWYVRLNEISEYQARVFSQENAIYSAHGQWGIVCSDYGHALLAGPEALINEIQGSVPDLEHRIEEFLDAWKYYKVDQNVDIEWIPGQLEHVFGSEKARSLMVGTSFDELLEN